MYSKDESQNYEFFFLTLQGWALTLIRKFFVLVITYIIIYEKSHSITLYYFNDLGDFLLFIGGSIEDSFLAREKRAGARKDSCACFRG